MATLVPELTCSDFEKTIHFYTDILGFRIVHSQAEEGFAFLEREGAELMIDTIGKGRTWMSGPMEHPFGRGSNLRIQVSDVQKMYDTVKAANCKIFMDMEEIWYPAGDKETGNRQFIVCDPDGYLLRFFQHLGLRDAA